MIFGGWRGTSCGKDDSLQDGLVRVVVEWGFLTQRTRRADLAGLAYAGGASPGPTGLASASSGRRFFCRGELGRLLETFCDWDLLRIRGREQF